MDRGKTIGQLLDEARKASGAPQLAGLVFDVLSHDSPVGFKGERMRLFLSDEGHKKALASEERGEIKIINHARVLSGNLHYDHKDRTL